MTQAVHDAQRLLELQALPLERKIQITQTRIIEWYQHYKGNVCVSFSGGKDSTVLLHIARQIYPNIPAVFSDTGLEYPEIREFVKSFDNVDIIRPKMNFGQVITTYGYPLIGKEVAEAIYYARRIRSQSLNVERERERERERDGQSPENERNSQEIARKRAIGEENPCVTQETYGKVAPPRRRTELCGAICWKPSVGGTTYAANCIQEIGNRGGRTTLSRREQRETDGRFCKGNGDECTPTEPG